MKNKFIISLVIGILLMINTVSFATTKEERIQYYYHDLVNKVQQYFCKGPLAKEIAKYAIVRQLHEDGPNKPIDYSVPGLSFGNPIKQIVDSTITDEVKISSVVDNEGIKMYAFKGEQAPVISAVIITKLFDHYIMNMRCFKEADRNLWERSKIDSYLIANNFTLDEYVNRFKSTKKERITLLKKCNRLYGPASQHIEREIKRLDYLLHEKEGSVKWH